LSSSKFINTGDSDILPAVVVNKTTSFTGALASDGNNNSVIFQLDDNIDATLESGVAAQNAIFYTNTKDKGKITFNAKLGATIYTAGKKSARLETVSFTENGKITNDIYSKELSAAGKKASLGGVIEVENFTLDKDSKIDFLDGAVVNSVVHTAAVSFAGSATLNKDIGNEKQKALSVTFSDLDPAQSPDKSLKSAASNIFATNFVSINRLPLDLTQNLTINAPKTDLNNATLNLGDSKFQVAGDNSALTLSGETNINFNAKLKDSNQIYIPANAKLAFAADAKINITANGIGSLRPVSGESVTYKFLSNDGEITGAAISVDRINIKSKDNNFTKWKAEIDAKGQITLVQKDNAENALKDLLGTSAEASDDKNIASLTKAAVDTEGYKLVSVLSQLGDDKVKVTELMTRLLPSVNIERTLENNVSSTSLQIVNRINSISSVSVSNVSGTASGDGNDRFGAWVNPFFSSSTQEAQSKNAGYTSSAVGASIGVDTKITDETILGGAFTFANNEIKHKDFKSGDKTKLSSMMFSLYGRQEITDAIFINAALSFGKNDVDNSEQRVAAKGYEKASAKYNVTSMGGEAMFGYNAAVGGATLTPMAGVSYTSIGSSNYTETGATIQNLKVKTEAVSKFGIVVGARISANDIDMGGALMTPEVHGFVNYGFNDKAAVQSVNLGATAITPKTNKATDTTFNFGLSANARFGAMEVGAGYDAIIAEKYISHQGSLKLRVNF